LLHRRRHDKVREYCPFFRAGLLIISSAPVHNFREASPAFCLCLRARFSSTAADARKRANIANLAADNFVKESWSITSVMHSSAFCRGLTARFSDDCRPRLRLATFFVPASRQGAEEVHSSCPRHWFGLGGIRPVGCFIEKVHNVLRLHSSD
jgi:hypothetical protein